MSTSGVYTLSATRDDLITFALKKIGVIPEDGTPSTAQQTTAALELNYLYAMWQADGLQLRARRQAVLFPGSSKSRYQLGPSGDHCADALNYANTTLSAAGAASDTTITVTSISGISDADAIGIILDDGTIQWTTVNGAPSGSTVTLTTALTGAASSGNRVYAFEGLEITLVRTASATGAVNLNIESKSLGIGEWITFAFKRGGWQQIGYGSLL